MTLRVPVPRRILLIRLSAIGDVVMATPLIKALRRTYPEAYLAWLAEAVPAELLKNNPDLDDVIVWPRHTWRALWDTRRYGALWREIYSFIAGLRRRRFDLVLDIQGLFKSALWARLSGARERVGLGSKEGSQCLMTRTVSRESGESRIASEYLHLANELRLQVDDFVLDIVLDDADEKYARSYAHQIGAYAVLCPFTTRPQKHWFEERWMALAHALRTRFGLTPVLLGGPEELDAAKVLQAGDAGLLSQVGRTTLGQSAALIKHAACLVGVDTGLTHLGIAYAVPTVALFGSTRPYLDTTRANARVLYHALECSPCRRHPICSGAYTCMRFLEVEQVVVTLEELLGKERHR